MLIRRGDIYYADLRPVVGSEQGGIRPVLVIQNDTGNRHSPTVIVAAITSKMNKAKLPTHVELSAKQCRIMRDSVILLEQLRTIDKQRLKDKVCHLDENILMRVDEALRASLESEYIRSFGLLFKKISARIDKNVCRQGRKKYRKIGVFLCLDIQNLQT